VHGCPTIERRRATAKVSVTIARDGAVLSARVVNPPARRDDGSIRRVLERVTFVAPFPAGAKKNNGFLSSTST